MLGRGRRGKGETWSGKAIVRQGTSIYVFYATRKREEGKKIFREGSVWRVWKRREDCKWAQEKASD